MDLNRIYHGDCLELMKDIPTGSIDMILCDLPYGTTRNEWDSVIPLEPLWLQYERIIKNNGAIVLTAQTPFTQILGSSNIDLLRYEWIWKKSSGTGHLNAKKMPMKNHENVLVFYKKLPRYNPQKTKGDAYTATYSTHSSNYGKQKDNVTTVNNGYRYPLSVQKFNTETGLHPTQKPVSLFEYLIKTYTNEGDTVLDNCIGSGTTAIAAHRLQRNFIGMELNEEYHRLATERYEKEKSQTTIFDFI